MRGLLPPRAAVSRVALALAWLAASLAAAAPLVYEGFDYPSNGSKPASGLAGRSGGVGFAGGWYTTTGKLEAGVDNFGLTYSKGGVDLVVTGNCLYAQLGVATNQYDGMSRIAPAAGVGTNGTTRWFSMLVCLADNPAHKVAPAAGIDWRLGAMVKYDATYKGWYGRNPGQFVWGVQAPATTSAVSLVYGQTVFLVMRVEYLASNQDRTTLWVNPTPALSGATLAPAETPAINRAILSPVAAAANTLDLQSSCEANLDEIRIGKTYYDVAPGVTSAAVPPQNAPSLTSPADGATVYSNTAQIFECGAVSGATGYQIQFDGSGGSPMDANRQYSLVTGALGAHTWRSCATNAAGAGPWSGTRSFTVVPLPDGSPITEDFEGYALGATNGTAWTTWTAEWILSPVVAQWTYRSDEVAATNNGYKVITPDSVAGLAGVGSKALQPIPCQQPDRTNGFAVAAAYGYKGNPGLRATDTAVFRFMFNMDFKWGIVNDNGVCAGLAKKGDTLGGLGAWATNAIDRNLHAFQIVGRGAYGGYNYTPPPGQTTTNAVKLGFNYGRRSGAASAYSTTVILPLDTANGFAVAGKGWNPDNPSNTAASAWDRTWYEVRMVIDNGAHPANLAGEFGRGTIAIRNATEGSQWVTLDFGTIAGKAWGSYVPMHYTAGKDLTRYDTFTVANYDVEAAAAQYDNFSFGLRAQAAPPTNTLTYMPSTGGSVSGVTTQTVATGGSGTAVTAVPDTGYLFTAWSDGVLTATRTDQSVARDLTATALFTLDTRTLTYSAGANGSIAGTTPQTVLYGAAGTAVTAAPNTNYHFVNWSDGSTANPRTDQNVTSNIAVTASFATNRAGYYVLTYRSGANGSLTGIQSQEVPAGGSGTAVAAVPATGYHFVGWSDGSTASPRTDTNATGNVTVTAAFAINTYTLTYAAGAGGTLSGAPTQTVSYGGGGTAVTAVPGPGYAFGNWSDSSTANPRTDQSVTGNVAVTANFQTLPTPTFVTNLLARAAIPNPSNAFVRVFAAPGLDNYTYGLQTHGTMTEAQWASVFGHVGHLSAYVLMDPYWGGTWNNGYGGDIGLAAAEAAGRQTAGGIGRIPTNSVQETRVRSLYGESHGLNIAYYFQDAEEEGIDQVAGGSGYGRLRGTTSAVNTTNDAPLYTAASADFDCSTNGRMRSFGLQLGLFVGNDLYGNWPGTPLVYSGNTTNGWRLEFLSTGWQGSNTVRFVTYKNGVAETAAAPSFSYRTAHDWLNLAVVATARAGDASQLDVEVKVTPVGDSSVYARTTTVSRPAMPASNQLFLLTTRTSTAAYQMRDVDDVTLRDEAGTAIAAYDFEPAVPGDVTNAAPIGTVADRSGLGHDLYTPAGRESNYLLWPVSGIEPAARRSAKQWLVDELLAARAAAGKPAPEIINNWRISDTPGRLAAWKSEGFTHGSAEAYWINPALATNENRVMSLVRRGSDPTRFAWADGSAWNQAYLGTEVRTNPPAASDYDDLITLQVLQGNRWFVVFTGMSNGHLGPSALDGDPVAMADFNADSIYAMCQAAAWFQSTASGLAGSTLTEEKYGDPAIGADTLYIRRDNALTTEAWFAGIKAAGTGSYAVSLPAPTGQVHSLKTGAITPVTNGTFALPLTTSAEPYYFRTDENRPDTVGGTYVWLPQAGTGNWSDPTKWDVGAPPPPDGKADVVLSNIVSGAESTIDAAWATNGALRSLTFDLGTKLDLKPVGIAGLKIGAGGLTVKGSANPGNLWSDYSPVNLEFTTNQAITTVGGRVLSIVSANFVSPPGMTLTLDLSSSGDLRFYGGSSAGFLGGMYLLRNVVALNGPAVYARLGATNALVVDDLYPTTLYLQYPTLLSNITATLPTPIVLAGSGSAGYSNRLSLVFPADMAAGSTQYVVNCTGGFASAVPLNPNWPGALVLYGSAGADLGRFGQVRVVFQGDGSRLTETGADSSHHFVVASQGYFVLDHPHAFGSNNCRRIALGYGATGSSGRPCAIKATSGNHVSGMIENGDSTAGSNEVRMVGLEGPGAVTFSGKIRVLSKDNPTLRTRMHFTAPPGGTATFSGPILDGDWDQDKAFAFQSPVIVSGGGTVVFAGTNTYGGPTVVTNGTTLLVNGTAGCGAGSNTLEVLAGSTLGGSGAVRSLATLLRSGACLSPGGTGAFGTLTVTNLTIEEGTTYRFDCGPTAGDLLSVQGGLTLPAALHVAVSRSGAGPSRSPVLIACTGPIVGTVSGWTSSYGIPILSGNTVVLQLESTLLIIR